MAAPNRGKYLLIPAYLVLDTSASMTQDAAFTAGFDALLGILEAINKFVVVADKMRVEVITFDQTARVVFPLGTREGLAKWLEEKKSVPIHPVGPETRYGDAFGFIRTRIEQGVQQIRSESSDEVAVDAARPLVFFVTDGRPDDDKAARLAAFATLTDTKFLYRPDIVCVGVGKATLDDLKRYGAGRYRYSSYTTGNSNLVLVGNDPKALIPDIISNVVAGRVGEHDDVSHYDDGDDQRGDQSMLVHDDLFWNDKEFEGLFNRFSDEWNS